MNYTHLTREERYQIHALCSQGIGIAAIAEHLGRHRSTIGRAQYETWKHTQLIIDVIEGTGGTFSLEGPEGKAFHTRSRVFTDAELAELGIAHGAGA